MAPDTIADYHWLAALCQKRIECIIARDRDHGSVAGKFNDPENEDSLAMLRFMRGTIAKE